MTSEDIGNIRSILVIEEEMMIFRMFFFQLFWEVDELLSYGTSSIV